MYKLNLSKDSEYHTQRNNKYVPLESCNTTAIIMALKASNIPFDFDSELQPEDYLTKFLQGEQAFEKMKELAPWAVKKGYPPQQVHVMLEWAVNTLLKKLQKGIEGQIDYFTTNASIQGLVYNLVSEGTASVLSTELTSFGHVITLVGLDTNQRKHEMTHLSRKEDVNVSKIKNFIIDDPYGNYHKNYEDVKGNDIKMPLEDFVDYIKTRHQQDGKWAHMFSRSD